MGQTTWQERGEGTGPLHGTSLSPPVTENGGADTRYNQTDLPPHTHRPKAFSSSAARSRRHHLLHTVSHCTVERKEAVPEKQQ
ncbi:hypothetical protein SRHO_G00206800 [Serrasalmus rhombeus]